MKPRVFAIVAHPDDVEFVMAGTLIHLRTSGYEIHYMNVANGCLGSTVDDPPTTARKRRKESQRACELLGAVYHDSLTNDLEIFYDRATLVRMSAIVREVAPEIVLTHAPADYMEDHMNTCRLAVTASFARCMPSFAVEPPTPAVDQPITVYHAQPHGNRDGLGRPVRPSIFVDIESVLDEKGAMLAAHESQKQWLDESQGLDAYIETMRGLSREVGAMSDRFNYAEGWRKHSHLGFCDEEADPLVAALPPELVQVDPSDSDVVRRVLIRCPGCNRDIRANLATCPNCVRCPNCGSRRKQKSSPCECGHPRDKEQLAALIKRFGVS